MLLELTELLMNSSTFARPLQGLHRLVVICTCTSTIHTPLCDVSIIEIRLEVVDLSMILASNQVALKSLNKILIIF